jgi:hypothetical protein
MKLFVFSIICVFGLVFSQSVLAQKLKSEKRYRAPSRSQLEEMFGQAVSCIPQYSICRDKSGKEVKCPEPEGVTCFQNNQKIIIKVLFTVSNYAKTIEIYDGGVYWAAVRAAEEIIMLNGRGRTLKKPAEFEKLASCNFNFTEEYEFLSMQFYGSGCQGSAPGGVTLMWKDSPVMK